MKKLFLCLGLLACVLAGCTEFEEPMPVQESDETVATASRQTRAAASTFTTLPDPYSLANMQAVYRNYGNGRTLQATHKYYRFKPQNQEQLDRLEDVCNLDLYDYHLDIEMPAGVEYVDPTIPAGEPTWWYAAVSVSITLPQDITKEFIRDCYIPADDESILFRQEPGRAHQEPMLSRSWRFSISDTFKFRKHVRVAAEVNVPQVTYGYQVTMTLLWISKVLE